jgi:hypothetical protein
MADQTTRQHSLKLERVRVDEVDDEPFPDAFAQVPRIEFPDKDWADDDENVSDGTGDLIMPVVTTRPIDVEVIAGMSTPEQWSSIGASRRHTENITDALTALGQLDIEHGTLSISGLDLIRRQLAFDRPNVDGLNLEALREAFRSTNPGFISVDDLASRIENPGFLRGFVEEAIADTVGIPPDPALPLKVLIVVMGVTQFDDDADVEEIRMDGECDCVAYHIRMRQNLSDLFDQVEGIIDPLDPDRYDVLHPEDLRKAIGRIVEDLERF